MLLFHGSAKRIEDRLIPHKARCDSKYYGNLMGIYCSNIPTYAFAFSVIKNRDNCNWSFDGIDTIKCYGVDIKKNINEYGYIYFIITDSFAQFSKRQFVLYRDCEYVIKKKICVRKFIKINSTEGIISIDSQKLNSYIFNFFKLFVVFKRLCKVLNIKSNKFKLLETMTDCDEDLYYYDFRHGYSHMWNTALYTILLCELNNVVDQRKIYNITKSAYYHDIGRFIDEKNIRHGERGAELFIKKYKLYSDDAMCENFIRKHDIDSDDDNDYYLHLLKDADAIDRLRFGLDSVNVEMLFNSKSKMLYKYVFENYDYIYGNEKINVLSIPFAYNGPWIAGNGPLAIAYEISKDLLFYDFSIETVTEGFDESPKQFINRIENYIRTKLVNKRVFFSGNHMGLLPVYRAAKYENLTIVVLDAHRDYKKEKIISHASFMNDVRDVSIVIYGYRDNLNQERPYNIQEFELEQKKEFLSYVANLKTEVYLDIDVDVIDPKEFPCTYCKLDNGISVKELYEIIDFMSDKTRWLSISEYVPILDSGKYYNIIEEILLRVFGRKV